MKDLAKDVHFDLIAPCQKMTARKPLFHMLAQEASAHLRLPEQTVFQRLIDKDTLTGSGIGGGVAIEHLKIHRARKPFTALVTLENPVDFDAVDNIPVDIVCLVLSPESDGPYHLRRLSRVSRLLKNEALCERLRTAQSSAEIEALLLDPGEWLLAA